MRLRRFATTLAVAALLTVACVRQAPAVPGGPAERSLDKCQNTLRSEGVKYVQATQKAIATCLGKVSTEVVKKNAPSVKAAVGTCSTQFEKIGRTDGKSLGDAFAIKVSAACDPMPAAAHTLDDLLGSGSPGVAEPLNVGTSLSQLCTHFGGDGSIDSAAEWAACMRAAQDCAVRKAISAEFPRALEWLTQLAAAMPPSDARSAVVATEAAIDGASDDGFPDLQCGNSARTGGFLATGQTTCWGGDAGAPVPIPCAGTDQDGETQSGAALAYVDNGDGTISDPNTGLMWEKKSDDDTSNDKDRCYPWAGRCSGDGTTLCGRESDCAVPGGVCDLVFGDCQTAAPAGLTIFEWVDQLNAANHAGHSDWRVPNRRELESLLNLEQLFPSVSAALNTNCGANSSGNPGCTVTTCGCTVPSLYASSTTDAGLPRSVWVVDFYDGLMQALTKDLVYLYVRAVRGGS